MLCSSGGLSSGVPPGSRRTAGSGGTSSGVVPRPVSLFPGWLSRRRYFFVISGYLITSLIGADLEQSKFSLVNFYERRVRRILPALYAVVLFSIVTTAVFLDPGELKAIGLSSLSVNFFIQRLFLADLWVLRSSGRNYAAPAHVEPLD